MPITSSAKKELRSSARKRVFNLKRKDEMNKTIKSYKKLVAGGQIDEAKAMLPKVQKAVDKAVKRGIIKKGNASRKKSRLSKKVAVK